MKYIDIYSFIVQENLTIADPNIFECSYKKHKELGNKLILPPALNNDNHVLILKVCGRSPVNFNNASFDNASSQW